MDKRFNSSGRKPNTIWWFYAHFILSMVGGVLWQFYPPLGGLVFLAAAAALIGGALSAAKESEAYRDR